MLNPERLRFKREVVTKMLEGTVDERKFICEQEFKYFCIYYFSDFFTHKTADFHFEAYNDLKFEKHKYLIWEWFRESGKSSMAKMFIIWCICFSKKRYIIFVCYEKDTAKSRLYDIAFWLQTNKYILEDFGQLFFEDDANRGKFSRKKSIGEFITTNKIKIEANSTQEPLRGRVYDQYRPDLIFFDDFENELTKRSFPITQNIIRNMDEAMTGLGGDGNMVFLCNYISDMGAVERLHQMAEKDPLFKLHHVDLVEEIGETGELRTGKIAWPTKYVFTDVEAKAINAMVEDKKKHVISIEEKKRTFNSTGGRKLFEQEMLNQPIVRGEKLFDPEVIRKMIAADARPCESVVGDWQFWGKYEPHHRYGMGADVAEGIGGDASAAVLFDFSAHPRAKVVGVYSSDRIAPDLFAYELDNVGRKFGECLIAPERNGAGYSTVSKLVELYNNVYEQEEGGDMINAGERAPTRYGFQTNGRTKPMIIFDLKRDVEDGLIEVPDIGLLNELLSYNQDELRTAKTREGTTKHFDKLMAMAIAWHLRASATIRGLKRVPETPLDKESRFDII